MKNITYISLLFTLLFNLNSNAQTAFDAPNFNDNKSEIGPLSINEKMGEKKAEKTLIDTSFSTNLSPLNVNLQAPKNNLFIPSETFNKTRFWSLFAAGTTIYTGSLTLLNNVWYAQFPRSAFHYFNDQGEWKEMDKAGHILTTYTAAKWVFNGVRWSGMKNKNATLMGIASGMAFQTTLEVLDGYSTEWGFSWADMAANTSGAILFGAQQMAWEEQRIILKISNTPRNYSAAPITSTDGSKTSSLKERTDDLYGNNYTQTFFKDYNALTFWLSVNPKSFNKNSRFPAWLNIAVGIGADNMFGGYNNQWPTAKPDFVLSEKDYPRYRQLYLSLDIDLSKVKTKSKALNMVLRTINFIKIPSPTLEFNSLNQIKFHPLFF
jgi:VanZ family protein